MRTRFLLNAVAFVITTGAGDALIAEEPIPGRVAIQPEALEWTPGPPSLPAGARAAILEGDPTKPGLFTMRLQLPSSYVIPPHRHPEAERVTVLSGSACVGFGQKVHQESSTCFRAGSFYVNPAGAPHFVWTADKEGITVQITGLGPWQLTYVDLNEDPRKRKSR